MIRPLAVFYSRRAAREVEEIHAWWREHRPAVPDLFWNELEQVLAILVVAPGAGVAARSARIAGVRRLLLQRTGYHLYYRARNDGLEVLAVWHAARGTTPRL